MHFLRISWRKSATLTNNVIASNSADAGSGIAGGFSSTLSITNCTIVGNVASSQGGGLHCGYSSIAIIKNTVLWKNMATNGGNEVFLSPEGGPSSVSITFSNVQEADTELLACPHCQKKRNPSRKQATTTENPLR